MFEKILALIEKCDRIIIHRHKNPDGDAIGSQIGLKHILKEDKLYKEMDFNVQFEEGDSRNIYGNAYGQINLLNGIGLHEQGPPSVGVPCCQSSVSCLACL